MHDLAPLPRRYRRRSDCRSGWVLFPSSHCFIICADCSNASVLPSSGHLPTCAHDSTQHLQLGHIGLLSSWCFRNFIVPAIPRMCLNCDIAVIDIPNAFVQTVVEDKEHRVIVCIRGPLVDILVNIAPEVYGPYVSTNKAS